jgi:hypothetical protein
MRTSTPSDRVPTGTVEPAVRALPHVARQAGRMTRGERDGVPEPTRVAASLRAVLAAVDAGEVAADDAQRAYLAGAAEALEALAPVGDGSSASDLR